jgi:integrase/recombinase XerD
MVDRYRRGPWTLTPDKVLDDRDLNKVWIYFKKASKNLRTETTRILVLVLLNTGLRAAELCALRVNQTPRILGDDQIWIKGKGKRTRVITIRPEISEILEHYITKIRPKFLPRAARRKDYSLPVFYSESRRPFNRFSLYQRLRRLGIRAGIAKGISPHKFRHTYATAIYQTCPDLQLVQNLLGHSSPVITTVYARNDPDKIRQVLRSVNIFSAELTKIPETNIKPETITN